MTSLHVTQPGSVLHLNAGRLQIMRHGERLHDAPSEHVDEVLLYGGTQATSQAMRHLLAHDISLHLLTQTGAYVGRLEGGAGGHTELLRAQVRLTDDAIGVHNTARQIVKGKLENARGVLVRQHRNTPNETILNAIETHDVALHRSTTSTTLDELRGLEGISAKTYFAALATIIPDHWEFLGRNRNPPQDPVNAMLSFAYTLILGKILTATHRAGLHPSMGFLHVSHGKRPALALDLLEEYRAGLVDRFVVALARQGKLQPEDFDKSTGVRLTQDAKRYFVHAFEERLSDTINNPDGVARAYRDTIKHQVRMMARYVRGDEAEYSPLRIR